ncbi:MAG: suppressor of fused domain protein [Ruminiclostridium sp.]|nr:suppressor of fused domain protein [Ruminiclostridium sp.]MDE6725703.1 suppressor of fused domain protein [Ruminiclostridium sp.]
MGLFGKKNKEKNNENKNNNDTVKIIHDANGSKPEEEPPNTSGWDAIVEEFERVYPDQKEPKHYGTLIPWRLGGPNPLDGTSIYDGGDYWHFVTFGLTELYDKESEDKEWSGYGMEFTFKLKKGCYDAENEEEEFRCICSNLDSIAKLTFDKGELFLPNEYVYTGQTEGMDRFQKSKLTGFITMYDPTVNTLDTPNGKVEFVEFIGVTDSELKAIIDKKIRVKELQEKLGTDVTDYKRDSVI